MTLFLKLFGLSIAVTKKKPIFASANVNGTIAQLVEQRTENPCVPGSIPGGTTSRERKKSLYFI